MEWEELLKSQGELLNALQLYGEEPLLTRSSDCFSAAERSGLKRKQKIHERRQAEIVKVSSAVQPFRKHAFSDHMKLSYLYSFSQLIKIGDDFYLEEQCQPRQMRIADGKVITDELIAIEGETEEERGTVERDLRSESKIAPGNRYDRQKAVQYAERWWNDYNPAYVRFVDNCTNFISQCLRAGNAPMRGYPNRSEGWWYGDDSWSFSWSVAHSMRWYLSGSTQGLRGQEVEQPEQLQPGDVICYDFDGDGTWQHTTIVVAKDNNNEPLVNAQTVNSRMRYWSYEDSPAWTPDIKYKFFHIIVD